MRKKGAKIMKQWRVTVSYPVWETETFVVEAETESEAEDKALEGLDIEDGEVDFCDFLGETKEIPETPDPNQLTMTLDSPNEEAEKEVT